MSRPEKLTQKCPFGCKTCGRWCTAAMALSHRFDCCGTVQVHDAVAGRWRAISNPTYAGYCTGPSRTEKQ